MSHLQSWGDEAICLYLILSGASQKDYSVQSEQRSAYDNMTTHATQNAPSSEQAACSASSAWWSPLWEQHW
jgi:hypothetical protein